MDHPIALRLNNDKSCSALRVNSKDGLKGDAEKPLIILRHHTTNNSTVCSCDHVVVLCHRHRPVYYIYNVYRYSIVIIFIYHFL